MHVAAGIPSAQDIVGAPSRAQVVISWGEFMVAPHASNARHTGTPIPLFGGAADAHDWQAVRGEAD
jgi:hypothetical protein